MYNKLFSKIVTSSIWLAPDPARLIWITMLALMDEDGFVQFASVANLAHTARIALNDTQKAVELLEGPDPDSGDPDHEGRRIERVPGGWMILNAAKYRELVTREIAKEKTRLRVAKHRAKKAGNAAVTVANDSVTPSDTEADTYTDTKTKNTTDSASPTDDENFDAFKAVYPKRGGNQPWGKARKALGARLKGGATWVEVLDGARRYQEFCRITGKLGTEFVLQAATFCGPEKHYLLPWNPPATKADVRLAGNIDAARDFMERTNAIG